jgi:hypothetical protein
MSANMNVENVTNRTPVQRGRVEANMHYRCSLPNCTFSTIKVINPLNRKQTIANHMARQRLKREGACVSGWFTPVGDNVTCNRCNKLFTTVNGSHVAFHLTQDRRLPEPTCFFINQEQEASVEQEPVQEQFVEEEVAAEVQEVQEPVQDVQEQVAEQEPAEEQLSNRDLLMIIKDQNKTVLEQNKTIQMLLVNLFRREPQTNPFDNLL